MDLIFYFKLYLVTIPIFFIVDLIWLGVVARGFYRKNLNHLLSEKTNWMAAVIFYLIYIVGILIFAIIPALESGSVETALLWGALFGFFTYATYDLTNMATLKDWPLKIVMIDICWGTILCAATSILSFYAVQSLF